MFANSLQRLLENVQTRNAQVEAAVEALAQINNRLINWSAADQKKVLELRSKLEVVNQQVLEQAVTKELTDEGSTVRKYDLNNDASPVLNILNWVVHQDDGPKHSTADNTSFRDIGDFDVFRLGRVECFPTMNADYWECCEGILAPLG